MRFASLFAASSLLLAPLALGCASPSPDDAAASTSDLETGDTTPAADAILVQQAQHVFSVRIGADGSLLGQTVDEQAVMVGDKVFDAKHDRANGTYECSGFGGDPESGEYHGDTLSLAEASGASTILVPMSEQKESDYQLTQGAAITGNVGPYVFVRNDVYYFGCGAAHPSFAASAFIWDTKNAKKLEVTAPQAAIDKATAELAGRGFADALPKLAEVIPRFDGQGHLSLTWRFEKDASHAEADGKGSDYSISAFIESKDLDAPLPPELAALADPPASIAAYLAANPNAAQYNPIIGWSRAE
jgi:hypothetical protein